MSATSEETKKLLQDSLERYKRICTRIKQLEKMPAHELNEKERRLVNSKSGFDIIRDGFQNVVSVTDKMGLKWVHDVVRGKIRELKIGLAAIEHLEQKSESTSIGKGLILRKKCFTFLVDELTKIMDPLPCIDQFPEWIQKMQESGLMKNFNSETGNAEWNCGLTWKKATVQTPDDWTQNQANDSSDQDLETISKIYHNNLIATAGNPRIVKMLYALASPRGYNFIFERFGPSFPMLMSCLKRSYFWDGLHVLLPTPFFSNIIRKLLEGQVSLHKLGIVFDIELYNIVFAPDDVEFKEPLLRSLIDFEEKSTTGRTPYSSLATFLEKVYKFHTAGEGTYSLAQDVCYFLDLLRAKGIVSEKLLKHSIFWEPLARLNFIIEIYNFVKWDILNVKFAGSERFHVDVCECVEWKHLIRRYPELNMRYNYAREVLNRGYSRNWVGLVNFIRDQFRHITEKMEWRDDNGDILFKIKYEVSQLSLEKMFVDDLFPKLVGFLYKHIDVAGCRKKAQESIYPIKEMPN